MELEEVRSREDNLKKTNRSLMQAISNEPDFFKDQTLTELQKANEQYASEIASLKKKHKEEVMILEKQVQELFLSKKDLQIDLKHTKTNVESEKYELMSVIKQLESEKIQLEKACRKFEDSPGSDVLQDRHWKENRTFETRGMNDSRFFYKENDHKSRIETLMTKLKSKKEKIKRLKERTNEKALRVRIEEMEKELETYKMILKKQPSSNRSSDVERTLRRELEDAHNIIAEFKKSSDKRPLVMKKDLEIQQLKERVSVSLAEGGRLNAELGKMSLKLQQTEMYWKMADQKRAETELALKNEIKFLIGKLLKAKSKLGNEDSKESLPRQSLVSTVRSQSVKKDVRVGKGMHPLDLSSITRSESPFCISNMDL